MKSVPHTVRKGAAPVRERLKFLDRKVLHAVVATESGGSPYTSLVAFALTEDARGLIFATPRDSQKYRNILKNRNVSCMIDNRENTARDYLKAEAVTITGTAAPVRQGKKRQQLGLLLIKKHPPLKRFIGDPSTALILVRAERCLHAGSFQSVSIWDVKHKS